MNKQSPEVKERLKKRRALIAEAVERGRRANWVAFDTAVQMEIAEYGPGFVQWFIRGYEQCS